MFRLVHENFKSFFTLSFEVLISFLALSLERLVLDRKQLFIRYFLHSNFFFAGFMKFLRFLFVTVANFLFARGCTQAFSFKCPLVFFLYGEQRLMTNLRFLFVCLTNF